MLVNKILEMRLASLEGCQSFANDQETVAEIILEAADESSQYETMTDLDVLVLFAVQGFIAMEKQWRIEQAMTGKPIAKASGIVH